MPVQRGGCAFGMIQGKMICAGGEEETSALTYTQGYDPIENTWTDYEVMPMATAGTLGAAIGEKLYVPGGARRIDLRTDVDAATFSRRSTPAARL